MKSSTKWEAYQRLAEHIPTNYLCKHVLCRTTADVQAAWPQVEDGKGKSGFRTDSGGDLSPFIHMATLDEALALVNKHGSDLVYLPCQYVLADVCGKAIRIDDDSVLIEWALCPNAREFDAGRVDGVKHIVLGPASYALWGDSVFRSYSPSLARSLHFDILYRELLWSGLEESAWSFDKVHYRIVLWG